MNNKITTIKRTENSITVAELVDILKPYYNYEVFTSGERGVQISTYNNSLLIEHPSYKYVNDDFE